MLQSKRVYSVKTDAVWSVGLVDVKNAYLNAELDDTSDGLFRVQPQGFKEVGQKGEKLFCRLDKALYGLKQAGRLWNRDVGKWFLNNGIDRSAWDSCLFYKFGKRRVLLIALWVDVMIYTGPAQTGGLYFGILEGIRGNYNGHRARELLRCRTNRPINTWYGVYTPNYVHR